MFVEKLKLFQFRNIRSGEYSFPEQVSFIVGRNGQGKSNLIEAICFLSSGRSFRTAVARELVSWGADACSVFSTVRRASGITDIGISIESGRRKAFINGDKIPSMTDYIGELVSVTFSPADLALVQGGPVFRRQFIDKHLVDVNPRIFRSLMVYARALQHRNALLKQGERNRHMYASLNQILVEEGMNIMQEKKKFVESVNVRAHAFYRELSRNADGPLTMSLQSSVDPESSAENYLSALEKGFDRDLALQSSRIGPHRDDVDIVLGDHGARSFASQGQVRSIVLSMKLAVLDLIEEMRGDSPVLLLDDIESELDRGRMEMLLSILFRRERQVIMTGTELGTRELFEDHGYHVFSIEKGDVTALRN